jgi:hypothetical protein
VQIETLYFEGCPSWRVALERAHTAVARAAVQATVGTRAIETMEEAMSAGFRGSPTILVDGVDPFADDAAPVAFACRVYHTDAGPQGSPTVDEMIAALGGVTG